jgi:hypothetical protein
VEIAGVIENMSGFVCPHCSETVDIFKSGGGESLARELDLPFLGKIPMDPQVVMAGDDGTPYLSSEADSPATRAFAEVVNAIVVRIPPVAAAPPLVMADADSGCACGGSCPSHGKN